MKVLVTGGCGYIGYSLIRFLLKNKKIQKVFLYDNLSNRNLNFFFGTKFKNKEKLSLVVGDILDNYLLKKTLSDNSIDVVVHLAAKASTPFADHSAHSFDQINNWGTACLVNAVETTLSVKKIINLSSIAVYGYAQGKVVNENTMPSPKSFYGTSKLRGEQHIRRLFPKREVYTIRAANVFGYNPCIRIDSVLNKFVFEAHFNNKIEIHGSGMQNRAFVHVEKLAQVMADIVSSEGQFPTLFNLIDCNLSIQDLSDIIESIYPDVERLYLEQHMEMRNIRATSNIYENQMLGAQEIIPLVRQISNNFTFLPKSKYHEPSLEK